jgi:hypothetical protein
VVTKTSGEHLAHSLLVYYDILRVQSVMQHLIFVKIRKSENTTTQYRHNFLNGESPSRVKPALDFVEQGVTLILKVLGESKLLGADVGLRDDFAVEGIEVELMCEGEVSLVPLHVFGELLLTGEGMLHDHGHLLGELVTHG